MDMGMQKGEVPPLLSQVMGLCFIICASEFPSHSIKPGIISAETTFLLDFLLIPNPHPFLPHEHFLGQSLDQEKTISGSDLENLA